MSVTAEAKENKTKSVTEVTGPPVSRANANWASIKSVKVKSHFGNQWTSSHWIPLFTCDLLALASLGAH